MLKVPRCTTPRKTHLLWGDEELYPDRATIPAVGTQLNKPATVSVYLESEWESVRIKVEVEAQDGVTFMSYHRASNMLSFRVEHF